MDELAADAGTTVEFARGVVAAGIVRPDEGGRFAPDAHAVVRTAKVLEGAGFGPELVGRAIADGMLSLEFLDQFSARRNAGGRSYGNLLDDLGERARLLGAVYAAFGLPEPGRGSPLPPEEERLVRGFVETWTALTEATDAPVRAARIVGEGTRRIVESFLDLWDESARTTGPTDGTAPISAPGGELSSRMAAMLPDLLTWLEGRHAEASVHARIIRSFEDGLEAAGRLPPRRRQDPAIAFVDLSGYTRLTEEAGDELAVRAAVRLEELAHAVAAAHGGRVVKLLGDGVVMRFPGPSRGLAAVLDLLPALGLDGLPPGHAGLASGPVVDRDGDVFGRTVNLAARLASVAGVGEVLVAGEVVEALAVEEHPFAFEPAGEAVLKGFGQPVPTHRVRMA
jgi:adenylate cyclase